MRESITHLGMHSCRGLLLFLVIALCLATACRQSSEQPKTAELQPVPLSSNTPSPLALQYASVTPTPAKLEIAAAKPDEVRQAISRIFEHLARMDDRRPSPYIVGDFNGDGSQDIAVVTRAADDALGEINNDLANWVLEDPHDVPLPGTKAAAEMRKPKPTKAVQSDELLTIIHGVGPEGWRSSEARQTYLLRNSVGADTAVQDANKIDKSSLSSNLPLHGDVISETVNGHRGLICWTGARYAWVPQR